MIAAFRRTIFVLLLLVMSCIGTWAQELPQEMVYLHMDNTCYFLGDTLYYKAYVQRSDTGRPTNLSGVLYVELLNQDGYLVEREMLRLKNGQADGTFFLVDTLYAGFYEMRAYTRWQLNFGRQEHEHNKVMDKWFLKPEYAKEFFVDYDKLYSRVFPVYDKPKVPGDYFRDMTTTKPLRRDFGEEKHTDKPQVEWYPEGGQLVAGLPQRIAFEVNDDEGQHLEGKVVILSEQGDTLYTARTENRGRGVLEATLQPNKKYNAVFASEEGKATRIKMPEIAALGAVMMVEQDSQNILANIQLQGIPSDSISLSVITCGQKPITLPYNGTSLSVPLASLPAGVAQLTLKRSAHVLADRLVFVNKPALQEAPLQIEGMKDEYRALERVQLGVKGPAGSTVSLSVRDVKTMDPITDNGNIMTEMLLSSHIKGFVEDPLYYFEADDSLHRRHLDLLLMVQGWRRFGEEITQLAEPYEAKSQVIRGEVNKFSSLGDEDYFYLGIEDIISETLILRGNFKRGLLGPLPVCGDGGATYPLHVYPVYEIMNTPLWYIQDFYRKPPPEFDEAEMPHPIDRPIQTYDTESLKEPGVESSLHAEFVQPRFPVVQGDATVGADGRFSINAPSFDGYCYMFLAASTPENAQAAEQNKARKRKLKTATFQWVLPDAEEEPKYSVRVHQCYPNFVEPYSFYQTQFVQEKDEDTGEKKRIDNVTHLKEVKIKAKRRILRKLDLSKPTLVLDAYDAFNRIVDAGMTTCYFAGSMSFSSTLARMLFLDMGQLRAYDLERRWDGRNLMNNSIQLMAEQLSYNRLKALDKVYFYTDYAPRKSGSDQYVGSDQPNVVVDLHKFEGGNLQTTYRDRYYVLWGYDQAQDFYHPDYSRKPLPDGQKDYRRTLYWNPNLKLDAQGKASITFYNNSNNTSLSVDAEGQAADGTLLWGK